MKKNGLAALLLFLACIITANAQSVITFKGENRVIGEHVAILEDSTKEMEFEVVRKSPNFVASNTQVPNLQLKKSDFWLRFTIKNQSQHEDLILNVEYPTLDVCELYYPVNGVYKAQRLSDKRKFHDRKYKHQDFLFDIELPRDSVATFYLRVASGQQMVLPLVIGTPQQIAEAKLSQDMLWGCLVGIMLVMMLYNLFVYISTRDRSYLYYVAYTICICLTQTTLAGYTYRFIFTDSPQLFNMGIVIFPALAGISLLLFAENFLGLKERMKIMSSVFKGIILLYSATIVVRLTGNAQLSYRMIDICALCLTFSVYFVVIKLSINGFRPARLFLLAWTMFLTGIILFVLRNLGVLPYNNFTNYTMQVGTAIEVTLLSLALADRINIFKAEKERSQEETVRALKENERIVREQNVILEQRVAERTQELNQSLEDLKQTQSQLVDAEKMASLGQLTAGIAHEINNPINFVTANIAPLKRDVEMLLDAMNVIEEIGLSDETAAEKQKKITEYKEELDFDYLLVEMNHLIKGIHEGASRTAEIVKGLRIFSRLDEDDLKRADLNESLESTMIIGNNLLNSSIKVIKEYGDLPLVECYAGKLNQVFLNIISNAAYAIEKQFGNNAGGELKLETFVEDDNAVIRITDNGIGMSDETMRKIFEPFFTTKDVGEGTGLGMSIAYNTIKKHHGQLLVTSTLGKGSVFTMKIPVIFDASKQV